MVVLGNGDGGGNLVYGDGDDDGDSTALPCYYL